MLCYAAVAHGGLSHIASCHTKYVFLLTWHMADNITEVLTKGIIFSVQHVDPGGTLKKDVPSNIWRCGLH